MGKRELNLIVAACLVGLLVMAGCSGGSQKRSPEPIAESKPDSKTDAMARDAVPLPPKAPSIVTFGDSLTAGVSGRSYPDQLQELLLRQGYLYRVENQGVSGDTTTDGLARIGNVLADHPALVVLEFGGNDGLRGIPVASTRTNLGEMITQIQKAKLPLVLLGITLPPNYGPDYVKPFTAMFPELAKEHHIPLMPFLLVHVYQDNTLMQPDGIHPNEAGNTIVAHDVFNLIRPMLRKQ